jgi:hypothetical protein
VARDGAAAVALADDAAVAAAAGEDEDFPAMANLSSLVSFVNGTCLADESANCKDRHRSGRSIGKKCSSIC